ncbi:MAG: radical SAM protein [Alistipes sp.]|nr:radical SAM protein [Alistipes sp.]
MTESEQQHFTGTVWRPPYEAHSVLLQATVGCTHHACKFCSLYGDLRFRLSPPEEIEADLRLIARCQPRARRLFLVGANPFVLSFNRLVTLADRIRDFLPRVRTIGMFARVTDIAAKSDAELRELRARGITGLSIGTETGDEPSLAFMHKGHTAADTLTQCRRLDEAGIEYYFTYMTGLAGAGNGQRAAEATAALFNRLHPYIIGIVSLTLFPEAPLAADVAAGRFVEAGERERLEELRTFIAALTVPATLMGHTVSNTVPLLGRLPEDRARLLSELDGALARFDESDLAAYRRGIVHL